MSFYKTNIVYKGHEEKEAFLSKVQNEADINADEIKAILLKKLEPFYKVKCEKGSGGYHHRCFDMTIGDESDFKMIGLEIKADHDSYVRLDSEVISYMQVMSETYIVLHKKEAPKLMPYGVGLLRVSTDGEVIIEQYSSMIDTSETITDYESDALFKTIGLGKTFSKFKEVLREIDRIKRILLFNRFFGTLQYQAMTYSKYWPLSEDQKKLIVSLDIPGNLSVLKSEINGLQRRLTLMKNIVSAAEPEENQTML